MRRESDARAETAAERLLLHRRQSRAGGERLETLLASSPDDAAMLPLPPGWTEIAQQLATPPERRVAAWRERYARLLRLAHAHDLLTEELYAGVPVGGALAHVARLHGHWIREPEDFGFPSHSVVRTFRGWMDHLMGRFPVPAYLHRLFAALRFYPRMDLFPALAQGRSLRRAETRLELTKRQAHLALRSTASTYVLALREAVILAAGGSPKTVHAVGRTFLRELQGDEKFWTTVLEWLARREGDLSAPQVGPLLDYVAARRAENENFQLKGRTPRSLLRATEEWHAQLRRFDPALFGVLPASGIEGFSCLQREASAGRTIDAEWSVVELRTGRELLEEGRAMRHCVYSYARLVQQGRRAIFSMRALGSRTLTIEIFLPQKAVVQARGKCNRMPLSTERRVLRAFCDARGLQLLT